MHGMREPDPRRPEAAERRRAAYASALEAVRLASRGPMPPPTGVAEALRCSRCRDLAHPCAEHARLIVELL
jgi:hypothetical protein